MNWVLWCQITAWIIIVVVGLAFALSSENRESRGKRDSE